MKQLLFIVAAFFVISIFMITGCVFEKSEKRMFAKMFTNPPTGFFEGYLRSYGEGSVKKPGSADLWGG